MEVVYFVISLLEIFLTVFLIVNLIKAENRLNETNLRFNDGFKKFCASFKKIKKALLFGAKVSKLIKHMRKFKKAFKPFKKLKSLAAILAFLQGKGLKKKFKIFPILRRFLFYV